MNRIWFIGTAAVLLIATIKTILVSQFVLAEAQRNLGTLSGLFALFTALTAIVAYVVLTQFIYHLERLRKDRLAPGADDTASKEIVVERNAKEWCLSQAETEVALFVAKGFSNGEIAEMRGCAIATVKSQLGRIYQKSGLATRYQLMAFVTDEVCAMAQELGQVPADVAPDAAPRPVFKLGPLKALTGKGSSATAANFSSNRQAVGDQR